MTRLRLPAALAALTLGLALAPATASAAPATLQVDPVQDDVLFADAFHGTMR
ncbi:hypothetical protein [Microlunatus flavus]|uniref:Uncharacterized protein n=1 Tax=Microlunatus flavus TaxID=1036181 RepID=A0A1H9F287_9ACTN|nr:hypothetical protein [Microlunatus flavus]SEQ32080.1 hypothetical protein SAMN05421756_103127 [Microlunatus flavus]